MARASTALQADAALSAPRAVLDHPDWLLKLKYDGVRALAYVNGGGAELFSRRDLRYRQFADLCSDLTRAER